MSGRVAVYLPVVPTRLEDQCINAVRRAEVRSPKSEVGQKRRRVGRAAGGKGTRVGEREAREASDAQPVAEQKEKQKQKRSEEVKSCRGIIDRQNQ